MGLFGRKNSEGESSSEDKSRPRSRIAKGSVATIQTILYVPISTAAILLMAFGIWKYFGDYRSIGQDFPADLILAVPGLLGLVLSNLFYFRPKQKNKSALKAMKESFASPEAARRLAKRPRLYGRRIKKEHPWVVSVLAVLLSAFYAQPATYSLGNFSRVDPDRVFEIGRWEWTYEAIIIMIEASPEVLVNLILAFVYPALCLFLLFVPAIVLAQAYGRHSKLDPATILGTRRREYIQTCINGLPMMGESSIEQILALGAAGEKLRSADVFWPFATSEKIISGLVGLYFKASKGTGKEWKRLQIAALQALWVIDARELDYIFYLFVAKERDKNLIQYLLTIIDSRGHRSVFDAALKEFWNWLEDEVSRLRSEYSESREAEEWADIAETVRTIGKFRKNG